MVRQIFRKLRSINPWHFVWIVVLSAEALTFVLSALQSYIRWGYVRVPLLQIAAVDAFACSLVLSVLVVYILKSVNDKLEREIDEHRLVIDERARAEAELRRYRHHLEELVEERSREISALNDQLQQSQKLEAVGLLAGGIAHDFNNILTTIKGSMYIISKRLGEDSPLLKYSAQVQSSVNKANSLAQSLLAFSRRQTVILRPVDLNEIIEKTGKLLGQILGEHIELQLLLVAERTVVLAEGSQIEQILLNLATNSRDAMPERGKLVIETDIVFMDEEFVRKHGFGVAGKYILLVVSDTGTGMAMETREKIFEPFFTTKELGKGSGLGLAVSYGIVRQHNGYILCESVPGRGTAFRIYLPAVETAPVSIKEPDVASPSEGTETILLAEDDPDTRKTVREVLSLSGYTVLEAGDGENAVSIHSEYFDRIDLAVLDVRMPKMNGWEVYEAIKSAGGRTAFLFMSGYTDEIIDGEGIVERGLNFISKSAAPGEILSKIREVLDNRENVDYLGKDVEVARKVRSL